MTKVTSLLLLFILIFSIAGCGKVDDNSLYSDAKKDIQEGKYLDALNTFRKLTAEYPNSHHMVSAKFEMGKLYQGNVIPGISKVDSYKESINLYTDVYTNFPDSVEAVNALFMIGFIQANELQDLDAAKNSYNEFIARYPDTELAVSARAELENLGKSPEQILQEKVNGSK